MNKIVEKIKANWKKALLFLGMVPGVVWLALRWPYLVVGLATIPVSNFIGTLFDIPPTVDKFLGLAIFFVMMGISWVLMELVVILAADAIVTDAVMLYKKITARFHPESSVVAA